MQFLTEKAYLLEHFQQYRIIQPRVIFIHGLPTCLSSPQVLQRELLPLGQTCRITLQHLSKDFYSAFIEFQSQTSAAVLIVMLNELSLMNRTLRVFYGSTKFCPHFLKNRTCHVANCNYAHYYVPCLTHLRDQAKDINHFNIAYYSLYQQPLEALNITHCILAHKSTQPQLHLLEIGSIRLQTLQQELSQYYQPQMPVEIEEQLGGEQVEWNLLEKQIQSETSSVAEQPSKQLGKLRVQNFLDAADRFLSRLIFQSSLFVY